MTTIQQLRNTGYGIAEGSQDTLYSVTKPDATVDYGYVGYAALYPYPNNSGAAKWLFPTSTQAWGATGTYVWKVEFDLTQQQVDVARITGRFKCDDNGQCFINGVAKTAVVGIDTWASFDITEDFVAGTNELTFNVVNTVQGNPLLNATSLMVEFTYLFSGVANAIMFSCNT